MECRLRTYSATAPCWAGPCWAPGHSRLAAAPALLLGPASPSRRAVRECVAAVGPGAGACVLERPRARHWQGTERRYTQHRSGRGPRSTARATRRACAPIDNASVLHAYVRG